MTDDHATNDGASSGLSRSPSRRQILMAGAGAVAAVVLAACGGNDTDSSAAPPTTTGGTGDGPGPTTAAAPTASATTLAPTPACVDDDEPTPEQTDGPFFKANSPEKTDLRTGAGGGTPLDLSGTVVTTACQPVGQAKIEFWQANDAGEYDNSGYTLRGHQFTDAQGRYSVQTVMPGLYPGRTRHIHVKVQAPNSSVLTTQLYFPGESANVSDGIYRSECLVDIKDRAGGKDGAFTFVLNG